MASTIFSDRCAAGSAAHFLQMCAAWPLPEKRSFALYSLHTLQ
ncbi:hypothetical protein [Ruminococcus sp.]